MAGKDRSEKAITFNGGLNWLLPASLLKLEAEANNLTIIIQKPQKEEADNYLAKLSKFH